MKARLKTVGVEEYHFVMENGPHPPCCYQPPPADLPPAAKGNGDWYIYDVGGSRSLVSPIASVLVSFCHVCTPPNPGSS